MRYLSLDWIDALNNEVASRPGFGVLAERHTIGVTQVVLDGPEGDVLYHLQSGPEGVRFGVGPADDESVRMEQSWDTAVAVATGELNAQEAFARGFIRLSGDQMALLDAAELFGALDPVFAAVRADTDYR